MSEWTPRLRRVGQEERGRFVFVNSLIREKRYDEAEKELDQILRNDASSLAANLAMGRLQMTQRKFDRAQQYLRRAHEIEPMLAQPVLMEGMCHVMLKDGDNAEHCFKQSIDIDPKLPGAYLGLAQLANKKNDIEKAIEYASEALRLEPQLTPARLMLARLYNKSGNSKASEAELKSVLSSQPENRAATFALAASHVKRDEYTQAKTILEELLRKNPADAAALNLLSRVQTREGDYAGAETTLRKVMAQRKRSGPAVPLMLVDVLIHQKKTNEARSLLESIPRRAHLRKLMNKAYGDLNFEESKYKEAIEYYRAVLLGNDKGRKIVEEAEKGTQGELDAATAKSVAERYRKAVADLAKAARDQLSDRDWQAMLERVQPTLLQMMVERRRKLAAKSA